MQSTITIPALGLLPVFLGGLAVGWVLGRVRFQGRLSVSLQKPGVTSNSSPSFEFKKSVVALNSKCQCGTTWKFHETSGHPDQGSQPMPTGDSFICPNCGRSIDLRQVHKMLPDAK